MPKYTGSGFKEIDQMASKMGRLGPAFKVASKGLVVLDAAMIGFDAYKVASDFEGTTKAFEEANVNAGAFTRALNGMSSPISAVATDVKLVADTFSAYSDAAKIAEKNNKMWAASLGQLSKIKPPSFKAKDVDIEGIVNKCSIESSIQRAIAQNEASGGKDKNLAMLAAMGGVGDVAKQQEAYSNKLVMRLNKL